MKELTQQEAFRRRDRPPRRWCALGADDKEMAADLKEVTEKFAGSGAAYAAAEALFVDAVKEGGKDDAHAPPPSALLESRRSPSVPTCRQRPLLAERNAAQALAKAAKGGRRWPSSTPAQAEKALAKDDAVRAQRPTVLKTLELALKKTGKIDEAKEITARR